MIRWRVVAMLGVCAAGSLTASGCGSSLTQGSSSGPPTASFCATVSLITNDLQRGDNNQLVLDANNIENPMVGEAFASQAESLVQADAQNQTSLVMSDVALLESEC